MKKYIKENLKELKEKKTAYGQMINYCCDNCIMNNYIVEELQKKDIFFETYCGSECTYYNNDLDLYMLCVKHWGTAWCGVPANWKEIEEEEEEE